MNQQDKTKQVLDVMGQLASLAAHNETNRLLREQHGKAAPGKAMGPKCPHCHGELTVGVTKPSKCRHCGGDLQWSQGVARAPLNEAKSAGPPCPHCGGELPENGGHKKYKCCLHCRRDLFWEGRRAYSSLEAAEKVRQDRDAEIRREQAALALKQAAKDGLYRDCLGACAALGVKESETPLVIGTTAGPLRATICLEWAPGVVYMFATAAHSGLFVSGDYCLPVAHHALCNGGTVSDRVQGLLLSLGITRSLDLYLDFGDTRTLSFPNPELCKVESRLSFQERALRGRPGKKFYLSWNGTNDGRRNSFSVTSRTSMADESVFGKLYAEGDNIVTLGKISRKCWRTLFPFAVNWLRIGEQAS